MDNSDTFLSNSRSYDSPFWIRALPNQYLVEIGLKVPRITLGGRAFRPFRQYLKLPASAEITNFEVECSTSNYIGTIVAGYVAWRIDPGRADLAIRSLDFYNISKPLAKTSSLICDMAKDAVRRTIAEIKVDQILASSEKLKAGIEGILKDVSKWGLIVDSIGINRIFIKSENVFDDLQKEDRNRLRLIAEMSSQDTQSKVSQNSIEAQKVLAVGQSSLKETQLHEEAKQQKLIEEARLLKTRLEKEREREEIRLSQENEAARYEYQDLRLDHDKKLQELSCDIELKKLDVAERRRTAEGGMTDREMTSLVMSKIDHIVAPFKESRLTIVGGAEETFKGLFGPLTAITQVVKSLLEPKAN